MLNATDEDCNFFTARNVSHFHVHGHVKRHSCRIWEKEQPLKSTSLCKAARKLLSGVVESMIVTYDLQLFC